MNMIDYITNNYGVAINYVSIYMICGVVCNLIYDIIISVIGEEAYRFSNIERLGVAIVWPLYFTLFIINFLKALFGNDKDNK